MTERLDASLIALRQILLATETSSRALAKKCGLTPTQLILMQMIDGAGDSTPGYIAREASISQATVTALLDKLEERGLVRRQRDDHDKRRVYITLTPEGERTLREAPDSLQERFAMGFNGLASWEQAFLVAALERTAGLLYAHTLDAAPVLTSDVIEPASENETVKD